MRTKAEIAAAVLKEIFTTRKANNSDKIHWLFTLNDLAANKEFAAEFNRLWAEIEQTDTNADMLALGERFLDEMEGDPFDIPEKHDRKDSSDDTLS